MEYLYCIEYKGVYNNYFSFVKYGNIAELAVHLNNRLKKYPRDYILCVHQTDDYDEKLRYEDRLFFQCEYDNQYFFETYEERLLEQHKMLAV